MEGATRFYQLMFLLVWVCTRENIDEYCKYVNELGVWQPSIGLAYDYYCE